MLPENSASLPSKDMSNANENEGKTGDEFKV